MNFRHDINGLRAIAVLAVVLFHFNPQWLPGGFAGVDIFFVISGFLMTSIIFNGVEKNTFNLFKFYNARANRIIPVLAALSVVLLIFGWFYLLPTDYRDLGQQIEKSSLFTSNLLFATGGGYFDTAEHTKWLLHTWSLSVEWQFYIFFPIIIITLKKYLGFTHLKHVVIGLFLASFIYCIYATDKDSKTAYFLLTSRAWEMLLGGLAFLYPWSLKSKKLQISAQLLGIILIITSYFLISSNTPWPGYMALIPVFGAYLIIVSNHQNNFIINNPVFNNIGKWSYSIYVWHWPLVVFGFYFTLTEWWMYGIPLSILLGFLSYHFIEKINFPRYSLWREIFKVRPLYIFLIILALGFFVRKTDGMKFHYSEEIKIIINETNNKNPYKCKSPQNIHNIVECKIGNQENIKAIVIGDSHADSLVTSITSLFNLKNEGVIVIATSSCPLISNVEFKDSKNLCTKLNKQRMELIASNKYKDIPIILISRMAVYIEGQNDPERIEKAYSNEPLIYFDNNIKMNKYRVYKALDKNLTKTLCSISKSNPTYITQPVPEIPLNIPKTLAKNLLVGRHSNFTYPYSEYINRTQQIRYIITNSAKSCGAKVLDPSEFLCQKDQCITEYRGRPIYRDGDHLSEYGNKLLTPMFKQIFDNKIVINYDL